MQVKQTDEAAWQQRCVSLTLFTTAAEAWFNLHTVLCS
jgi:hypothetical protein